MSPRSVVSESFVVQDGKRAVLGNIGNQNVIERAFAMKTYLVTVAVMVRVQLLHFVESAAKV